MNPVTTQATSEYEKTAPLCPVFGECGGCAYQDVPYEEELKIKSRNLKAVLMESLRVEESLFEEVTASPKSYHYRHRLDLTLKRSKGNVIFGFQSPITRKMVPVETCAIAMEPIAEFMPQLKEASLAKLPADYRTANVVVRTGDEQKVYWGGIGRKSLEMRPEDYLWTEIDGKRIFYSLETFFQANLSILPAVTRKVKELAKLDKKTLFLDLYAGVGLFGICAADQAGKVILIEDNTGSVKLAKHNIAYHGLSHVEVRPARVEAELVLLETSQFDRVVGMIDPPRAGLSTYVAETLSDFRQMESLLYLSCHPESLARDLKLFTAKGWRIEKIVPFDFFPKTAHLETLVLLKP